MSKQPDTDITYHEAEIAAVKVNNNFKALQFNWEKYEDCVKKCGELHRTLADGTTISLMLYTFHGEAAALSMRKFSGLKFLEVDIENVNITVAI